MRVQLYDLKNSIIWLWEYNCMILWIQSFEFDYESTLEAQNITFASRNWNHLF